MTISSRASQDPSRRRFLRTAGLALAGGAAGAPDLLRGQEAALLLPPYVTDVDGSGAINAADGEVVRTALYAQRGYALTPRPGFDYRADVLGRAAVEPLVVDSVARSIRQYADSAESLPHRPVTVAWHYGWYNRPERNYVQTVRFKGGDYRSSDPDVETTFNDLKNEFGVAVDALSWIPPRANRNNNGNYAKGFLRAPNAGSRHVCLLYESTLALDPAAPSPARISFHSTDVRSSFRGDFAAMARFLRGVRDESPARIFTLDSRPVVFIFGTHVWGRLPLDAQETAALRRTIEGAREDFRAVYGAFPYLVGEEMQLSSGGTFTDDRRARSRFFDAVHVYHHASNVKSGSEQRLRMSPGYVRNQINVLRSTYANVAEIRNDFTGRPLLVIPNLAPGFAKAGHPTLEIARGEYADFMKLLKGVHMEEHVARRWSAELGTAALPAPVYVVGSWNEEFEGHCLFPFSMNLTVPADEQEQHGFDVAMALKEVFGWNHYALRDIDPA